MFQVITMILKIIRKVSGDGLQSPLNVVHDTRRMLFVSRQYKVLETISLYIAHCKGLCLLLNQSL